MCVRSGVAPTCQSRASVKVDATTGAGPPATVTGGETTATSSPTGARVTARSRSRGVSALASTCGGSATPNAFWTRSSSSDSSRLPMPRSSNGLSSVTVSREACGWTSAVSPRTISRTQAAGSSLAIGQEPPTCRRHIGVGMSMLRQRFAERESTKTPSSHGVGELWLEGQLATSPSGTALLVGDRRSESRVMASSAIHDSQTPRSTHSTTPSTGVPCPAATLGRYVSSSTAPEPPRRGAELLV